MTDIGAHGSTIPAHDVATHDTHETAPHDSQRTSQSGVHERTQHGNGHQRAAKQQSARVHAAQVAKTKLTALHIQQRVKAARRAQIVAFYRNHKFATVAAGKAASIAAQKMLRQFGERPRPTTPGRALAHKRSHARGDSHGVAHEAEHDSKHVHLGHLHAGEHTHDQPEAHPHPKHPPHQHRGHGQQREGRKHDQEQGRHSDTELEDPPEQDQKRHGEHERESGRGQDDDRHHDQEQRGQDSGRGQEQGQGQRQEEGQGQEQGQNQGQEKKQRADLQHPQGDHGRRRADGAAGFAKASRRGVLSAGSMAAVSRATAPQTLQAWAREHRGAMDLSERLVERYASTLVNVAPRLEFGAAMAPLLLLSLLSPMSSTRDAARFASQRAAALASAPPNKASVTSSLLGHAEDANAARQVSGTTFTEAQQSLMAVKQWLIAASTHRDTTGDANVDAVSPVNAERGRGIAATAQRHLDGTSHSTLNVRVSGVAGEEKT